MPVKDRKRTRLIRLGVWRLGHKEKRTRQDGSEYEFPVQDDHFLLHDAPDVEAFYRGKGITEVREIRVRLPFPDVERNMPTWYQVWAGGLLVCKGDGEFVEYAAPFTCSVSQKTGRTSVKNAPGNTVVSDGIAQIAFDWGDYHYEAGEHVRCPGGAKGLYPHCAACKLSSILKVLMAEPELMRLGYYQISTGSGRNYDSIYNGTLSLLPPRFLNKLEYTLRRVKGQTMFKDENGVSRKRDSYFLELEPDPEMLEDLFRQETARALGRGSQPAALLEASRPWDEGELYDGEFDDDPTAPPPYAEDQKPDEPVVVDAVSKPVQEPKVKTRSVSFTTAVLDAVVKGKYADDKPAAMKLLNLSGKLSRNDPLDIVLQWCKHRQGAIAGGDVPGEAAKYADLKTFEGLPE